MAHLFCDFNPADGVTVGTVGPPGQRLFLFQASQGPQVVTLAFEKEQARALSNSLLQMLGRLETEFEYEEDQNEVNAILASQTALLPAEPEFRIGQMGIGYDQDSGYIVIIVYELTIQEDQEIHEARFWIKREQARALLQHTLQVVEAGRPLCPLCNRPMDPQGHSCPRSNGHGKPAEFPDLDLQA